MTDQDPILAQLMSTGNWTDPNAKWSQADTHERHQVAAGKWSDPIWAYVKDGPPAAPTPGPKDDVFLNGDPLVCPNGVTVIRGLIPPKGMVPPDSLLKVGLHVVLNIGGDWRLPPGSSRWRRLWWHLRWWPQLRVEELIWRRQMRRIHEDEDENV